MKILRLILLASVGVAALALIVPHWLPRYEFKTSGDGLLVYRFDRWTGTTWYSAPLHRVNWTVVSEPFDSSKYGILVEQPTWENTTAAKTNAEGFEIVKAAK